MSHDEVHMQHDSHPELDCLLPREMAAAAARVGTEKARFDPLRLLVLAVLAGAFIGFGGMSATIAASGAVSGGVARLVMGVAFSLGLILVVVGGAELFTGDNLMVMAWASRKIRTWELLRAWGIVYVGNLIGAMATALLVFLSGLHLQGHGAVGLVALATIEAKASLPFWPALVKGILANVLVCLAVWLSYGARSTIDKIFAVVPPVAVFVAAGFEHSVANMYLIPYGLLIRDWLGPEFWHATTQDWPMLSTVGWDLLWRNLLPVTIGNLIGGGVFVGAVYWFVYLRKTDESKWDVY